MVRILTIKLYKQMKNYNMPDGDGKPKPEPPVQPPTGPPTGRR